MAETLTSAAFLDQIWQATEGRLAGSFRWQMGNMGASLEFPDSDWEAPLCQALCAGLPAATPGAPDLAFRVFSRAQLGLLPPFPLELHQESARGRIEPWCDDRFLAVASVSGMVLADRDSRRAVLYYPTPDHIPVWDRCAPVRVALGFLAPECGYHLLHGGAVEARGRAALLIGRGGAGKTSSALATLALDSQLRFLSEDYTMLMPARLEVHPLYRSFKVGSEGMARMPWLSCFELLGEQDGKRCGLLPRPRLGPASQLGCLIWPDLSTFPSGCSPEPLSAAEAMRRLIPSTLFQNPNARPQDFQALTGLCRRLPSYRLPLGDHPDAGAVVERLQSILDQSGEGEVDK